MAATLSMRALCKQTAKLSFGSSMAGRQVSLAKAAPMPKVARAPLVIEAAGKKLKTCKAAAKRYRVTGTGKVSC